MEAARDHRQPLKFQENEYQLFTDLALTMLQKRRAMKPLLAKLQQHGIQYKWGFPFALIFNYKGKRYALKTPEELDNCLRDLKLADNPSTPHQSLQDPRPQKLTKRDRTPSPRDQSTLMQRQVLLRILYNGVRSQRDLDIGHLGVGRPLLMHPWLEGTLWLLQLDFLKEALHEKMVL